MITEKESVKKRIAAASKGVDADLVIKNGKIVDVFNLEIIEADVAVSENKIVGIGHFQGKTEVDASGQYICPSFIDGHVHIESSMVTPSEFSKVVLPHGVTTVIADPHEIANVSGTKGIQYMLDASEGIPLDVFVMLPSCVPATPFENSGATLLIDELKPFFRHERVIGLGEVMDFPSVKHQSESMIDKLSQSKEAGAVIDGHGAGLSPDEINVYSTANIQTDHECETAEEAKVRLQRGLYVMLREGSVAKNVKALLKAVTPANSRRCFFCTDDKHLDELITEGSIDHNIRLAVEQGFDPLMAIQMASLNAAECYGLKNKGAIAPGYEADFLLLDDLNKVTINKVYKSGYLVAENGKCLVKIEDEYTELHVVKNTVNLSEMNKELFKIPMEQDEVANIIEVVPNSLVTRHRKEKVASMNGEFESSVTNDLLKIAVVERHHATGNIGLGIVNGLHLKKGAIATTIAHDSHNVVVTGVNDADIVRAVKAIETISGGIVVVNDGEVIASLPLPIAGLMTDQKASTVVSEVNELHKALSELGFAEDFHPFVTLSFLALPVIPELKMTDKGLFDVKKFAHIPLFER